ncbi:MAG: CRISPR-associated protein Csx16 [Ghiorsea sp.]|nr:CRISPR-associated protein Csx16 [Ghiorsea sp.]
MTTYFVSRHSGAVAWAAEEGIVVDKCISHLDVQTIKQDDVVIGTLPVHMVAAICSRGGRYLHLNIELSPELRGKELTAADMRACHVRLEGYSACSDHSFDLMRVDGNAVRAE